METITPTPTHPTNHTPPTHPTAWRTSATGTAVAERPDVGVATTRADRRHGPRRRSRRIAAAVGLAAIVVGAGAAIAVRAVDDDAAVPAPQATEIDRDAVTRDLVNRGLVPRAALEPKAETPDSKLGQLVNLGLIPRQALEPEPSTAGTTVQDLVRRGVIPQEDLD